MHVSRAPERVITNQSLAEIKPEPIHKMLQRVDVFVAHDIAVSLAPTFERDLSRLYHHFRNQVLIRSGFKTGLDKKYRHQQLEITSRRCRW